MGAQGDGGQAATPAEVVQRKLRLALLAVRDPHKLSIAVGSLYTAWLAVIATLRVNFAKTVTLGVSMAEMLDGPALRYGLPVSYQTIRKARGKALQVRGDPSRAIR